MKQRINKTNMRIMFGSIFNTGWLLAALLLLPAHLSNAATLSEVTILRGNVQMRKGPASYYEILAAIPENTRLTPLESTMGWYKVRYDEKEGFISAKAAQPLAAKEDVFSQMATQMVGMKLSSHGMSAGAKGFADRFSKQIKGNPTLADEIAAFQIQSAETAAFVAATYKEVPAAYFRKLVTLPPYTVRSAYSYVEQGLGRSIAAKIAAMKLIKDTALIQYINQVGQVVVSASAGFDLPFSFFVIDDAKAVNAYACPGGYIFLTSGLLRHIKDEAELAAVLAHEVAHVTHQHGLQEIAHRRPMVVAENAFAELDEETDSGEDDKWKAVEEDLNQMALNAYETIFEGRLSKYELDADHIGLFYTARSGYDPKAMLVLLQRLKHSKTTSSNEHYTYHQVERRLKGISIALNAIPSNPKYFRFPERWRQNTGGLK